MAEGIKVLISMPSMGNPSFKTLQSMVTFAATKQFHCLFHYPEGSVIHQARNSAVQTMLRYGCSHLMFIDDDMVFDKDAILRLLIQDKDIIGALCFGRTDEMIKPICKKIVGQTLEDYQWSEVRQWQDATEVATTGTGFLLIKREVLEKMQPPHFYFSKTEDFGLNPQPLAWQDISEDTTFMLNARKLGFKIWVDPTIIVGHHGKKSYQRPEEIVSGEIAILIPTMGRFEKLEPLIENIRKNTATPYNIYFATDEPEAIKIIRKLGVRVFETDEDTVSYAKRINMMFAKTKEPLIFTGSNDITFDYGWDIEARKKMSIPKTGVVAVNDLFNPDGTNFLISRLYIDAVGGTFENEEGKVFYEYDHNFCDTELVAKAKSIFAYQKADSSIVEHQHPLANKSQDDWVYKKGQKSYKKDEATFRQRYERYTKGQ